MDLHKIHVLHTHPVRHVPTKVDVDGARINSDVNRCPWMDFRFVSKKSMLYAKGD
jgi:hypothetical protein